MNYYEILSLSNFYFEDSYVLSIDEVAGLIIFELDAVLTKNHPQYEDPRSRESQMDGLKQPRISMVSKFIM